jgi:hypothetical protein
MVLRCWLLALLLAFPAVAWPDYISYGDGSLTLDGAGYTDVCLGDAIDLQHYCGCLSGRLDLTAVSSPGCNTFFEIGILAEGQYSFWHTSKGDPEDVWDHGTDHFEAEWFNHGVYLLAMAWDNPAGDDYYWLYPQDWMGDTRAETAGTSTSGIYDFQLWFRPDTGGWGGVAQVYVEGVGWGLPLEYGVQKEQYGDLLEDPGGGSRNWLDWDEEFSRAHLYIALWSSENNGAHTVSFQDIHLVNPEPASFSLVVLGLGGLWWVRRTRRPPER